MIEKQNSGNGDSVLVIHGIHSGHYPVVGMTVAQARKFLAPHLAVDPSAKAVIEGEVVRDEEGRVITRQDQLLGFIKYSAAMGA